MVIIRKTNCVIQWIEINPMNSIIHSYNQGQHVVVLTNMGLDSMLLRQWKKICPDLAPHDFGFIAYSKVSTLESGLKKMWTRLLDSPDTCGRRPNPQRQGGGIQ